MKYEVDYGCIKKNCNLKVDDDVFVRGRVISGFKFVVLRFDVLF